MVPCGEEIVRRWRDISIGEKNCLFKRGATCVCRTINCFAWGWIDRANLRRARDPKSLWRADWQRVPG